jgi:hypothetical protein
MPLQNVGWPDAVAVPKVATGNITLPPAQPSAITSSSAIGFGRMFDSPARTLEPAAGTDTTPEARQ